MRDHRHLTAKRLLSLTLAVMLAAGCAIPAAAAEPIGDGVTPTFDEAYYATLDYYGNLLDGSVVKSYTLNGAASITDYGTYDAVNNLSDGTMPALSDGQTTFDFGTKPQITDTPTAEEPDTVFINIKNVIIAVIAIALLLITIFMLRSMFINTRKYRRRSRIMRKHKTKTNQLDWKHFKPF